MADWTEDQWKSALSAHGTDDESEAYQRLGQYLFAFVTGYLRRVLSFHEYLQRQSDADLDDLAREFVQRTVEKVWLNYDNFGWRSHVKTWATTILIREVKQFLRRGRIRNEFLVSYTETPCADDNSLDPLEYIAITAASESGRTSEADFDRQEFVHDLEAALAKLSDKQRYVFVECCLNSRPVPEVAQELGLSIYAVYKHNERARKKLRIYLRALGYTSGFD